VLTDEMPNTDWRPSFCERQVYCRVALPDLALLALPPHTRQWRSSCFLCIMYIFCTGFSPVIWSGATKRFCFHNCFTLMQAVSSVVYTAQENLQGFSVTVQTMRFFELLLRYGKITAAQLRRTRGGSAHITVLCSIVRNVPVTTSVSGSPGRKWWKRSLGNRLQPDGYS
jgi:hypothetical protein